MRCLLLLSIYFSVLGGNTFSQTNTATVYGVVKSTSSEVPGIAVYVEALSVGSYTDKNGEYSIKLPPGTHTISFRGVGFEPFSKKIDLKKHQLLKLDIVLKESVTELEEIAVVEQSLIAQIKETPFNVVALEAKQLHNSTLNLSQMLNKASGVKVRETGGVGSDASITLNGFRGQNVKVFLDGVPMKGFGSAFQINNIPVNLADRIEVYKGVIPIEFGADAMGGVVNIVTNQNKHTYLDASYSYGSFNTHKSSINLNHTTKAGFSLRLNAYQNYSDNDYRVKTTVLMANGNYSTDEYWVKRFHDAYHNETVIAKMGFVNKPWADQIYLGITLGQEYSEIQNSSLLQFVYGERTRSAKNILPSFEYKKKNFLVDGIDFRATANYNINYNSNVDTASTRYNWFVEQLPSNTKGEVGVNTLSDYTNTNTSSTANISYRINEHHSLALNNVISGYKRKLSSDVELTDETTAIDTLQRKSFKNVLGLSYRYKFNKKFNVNIFGKNYYQSSTGPYDSANSTAHPEYIDRTESYSTSGYGVTSTYFFDLLQVKASFERVYRLPSERELFGDEVLETANGSLRAENSMNYNLGVSVNKNIHNAHFIYLDVSSFYRYTKDFIRRVQEQRYGSMANINHGRVRNIGFDAEIRYDYKRTFMLGGTITYMDMRNKERYRSGTGSALSGTYNDRMPNIPYFFGNMDASYVLNDFLKTNNQLTLNYTFNFVGEYYLLWESQGNSSTKSTLPQQLYHDFSMSYTMRNGRYNIAFETKNFTNEILYDNFSLQKPGRSFNVKLRYFIMSRNQ